MEMRLLITHKREETGGREELWYGERNGHIELEIKGYNNASCSTRSWTQRIEIRPQLREAILKALQEPEGYLIVRLRDYEAYLTRQLDLANAAKNESSGVASNTVAERILCYKAGIDRFHDLFPEVEQPSPS